MELISKMAKRGLGHIRWVVLKVLFTGLDSSVPFLRKQRVIYFNSILLTLPLVYILFVLQSIDSFLIPVQDWAFDQWAFFLFIAICFSCFYLNHLKLFWFSKMIFLLLWPLLLHIGPVYIQQTPLDYYIAFPLGIIFHSFMIQAVFSVRESPWWFIFFMVLNFSLLLYFPQILQYFDTDAPRVSSLASDSFYWQDVFLYWLLFNGIIFYILGGVDRGLKSLYESRNTIHRQKRELENAVIKLKESNQKLIESEKMASLGVFTSGIAHELNNPLNFISAGCTVLSEKFSEIKNALQSNELDISEKVRELDDTMKAIHEGVHKSSSIVKGLNNYTTTDNQIVELDLVACIHNSLALIPYDYRKEVSVQTDLPESVMVKGNPGKLSQVVVNLVQNAIDASGEKGKVNVRLEEGANQVTVQVLDEGSGIPKEDLDRIFDPFYTTKEVGRGTGLGLYVVYGIIKEHRGEIRVKSTLKKGTTVVFTLRK